MSATPNQKTEMSFLEALEILGIADFYDRIIHSNSHGELHHCLDYILLAIHLKDGHKSEFRSWFLRVVDKAEKEWQRPESIFQHIGTICMESLKISKGKP